ncbi:hypothetical protein ACIA8O_07005 [Kitasatospora sp. NPDC051853]|uniref:hypothetical protein n=1 Tax=Kitasatospora sp. NPDC051853 TaxID=3364058 RepID=UPI0037BBAE3D
MKDFRRDLDEELSSLEAPPVGDLVGQALRQGRRVRRRRTLGAVAGSALAVAGVALLLGGPLRPHVGGAAATEVVAAATPSPAPVVRQPTTGAALLSAVAALAPEGMRTGGYAAQTDGVDGAEGTGAQVYLTGPSGTGMIRVFIGTTEPVVSCFRTETCRRDDRGQQVTVDHMESNCVQDVVVTSRHHDGTVVQVSMGTCLAWTPGQGNPTGVLALTEQQAVALAGDPALSVWMTADEGLKAAAAHPDLPRIS